MIVKTMALLFAAALTSVGTQAQDFPSKPIRLIVPFAPGGATDIIARTVGQKLSEQLGQPVVVENRTGGGGNIGTEAIVRAAPDGYTVGICGASTTIAPALNKSLSYDVAKDLVGIHTMTSGDNVLMVPASSPARNVRELVTLLKQKGDKANYASAAVGGSTHLATELFKMETGTTPVHIPFRGSSPALVELIAGRVDMMFDNIPPGLPHVKAGTLRALATTGQLRNASLPEVPTFKELGIDVDVTSWTALCAPVGTPRPKIEKLSAEIEKAIDAPDVKTKLAEAGQTTFKMGPAQLQQRLGTEVARWKSVAEIAKIKIE
jgi:tripartite-type tricarboxylate transporter receptor subunit TctC